MFVMKLFLLQIGLNFLKALFQKILFYTVSQDICYEKFHDDHTHHNWSFYDG